MVTHLGWCKMMLFFPKQLNDSRLKMSTVSTQHCYTFLMSNLNLSLLHVQCQASTFFFFSVTCSFPRQLMGSNKADCQSWQQRTGTAQMDIAGDRHHWWFNSAKRRVLKALDYSSTLTRAMRVKLISSGSLSMNFFTTLTVSWNTGQASSFEHGQQFQTRQQFNHC